MAFIKVSPSIDLTYSLFQGRNMISLKNLCNVFFLIATTTICSACYSADSDKLGVVKISKFRQGLIDFDSLRGPSITKEGNNFPYMTNGTCTEAGKDYPCIWYGFEFSFESPENITVIECVSTSDRPQTYGNPREVLATNSQVSRYGFTLKGRTGHYIRPQYTFNLKGRPLHTTDSCTHNGREVLRWELTLIP